MKKIIITGLVFLATATFISANDMNRREIAENGTMMEFSGTLEEENGEWTIETSTGTYDLHLGPEFFRDEIKLSLKEDSTVRVKGFTVDTDISVTEIIYQGKSYTFRDADGRPMWASRGNNRNRK
jgi:hypothetical protein